MIDILHADQAALVRLLRNGQAQAIDVEQRGGAAFVVDASFESSSDCTTPGPVQTCGCRSRP